MYSNFILELKKQANPKRRKEQAENKMSNDKVFIETSIFV